MNRDLRWQLFRALVVVVFAGACSSATPPAARDAAVAIFGEGGHAGDNVAPGVDVGAGTASAGSGGATGTPGDAASETAFGPGGAVDRDLDAGVSAPDLGDRAERGDASPVAGDFTCTELVGLGSTREWYQAGFENAVVNGRWQLRWHHRGYVEDWADVKNPYWGSYCDGEGCSRVSACAVGADSPDRVVFVALNWIYTTKAEWETDIRKDVDAIARRYPGVRNIEIISSSRCPDRCTTIDPPGTTSELTAVQTCRTPAYVDDAIAAVAASHPALVTVGPKFFTEDCAAFVSMHGPHLTSAGQKEIAAKAGAHYAAHP
jgi:hypothetical protein